MSSKADILRAIRAQQVGPAELPTLDGEWITYEDRFAQFQRTLEMVGGKCFRVSSPQEISALLNTNPKFTEAKSIASLVAGVNGNVDANAFVDPHELEKIDWAILPGTLAVAENAAIWCSDEQLKHRALYFIVQHLSLVLPASALVNNMHEAYGQISVGASSLGVFISGPSKTADIEQSLVIGAHGPRSLSVFFVDSPAA